MLHFWITPKHLVQYDINTFRWKKAFSLHIIYTYAFAKWIFKGNPQPVDVIGTVAFSNCTKTDGVHSTVAICIIDLIFVCLLT